MITSYKNKAIFFDRDGTINNPVYRDNGFFSPRIFNDFSIYKDVKECIDFLVDNNFLILIISNQPDISRKKMEMSQLEKMNNQINDLFHVDDIYYSFDSDVYKDGTKKPSPKMLFDARKKWSIDFSRSYFIGDTLIDKECAQNAGVPFILISREHNKDLDSEMKINDLRQIKNVINIYD